MREQDCHRFATEINNDKVVVPIDVNISQQPRWNVYDNNHFAMRRRLVGIFLKVANKLITRIRAGRRLTKIKKRFEEAGVMNREDAKRMVADDWKQAQNARLEGSSENETNITNVKFKFGFNAKNIFGEVRLPIEFDNIASFIEKIDAEPVISFDDLQPFDPIETLDYEIMKYKPMPPPPISSYDP